MSLFLIMLRVFAVKTGPTDDLNSIKNPHSAGSHPKELYDLGRNGNILTTR